jgi:hypothetical protein
VFGPFILLLWVDHKASVTILLGEVGFWLCETCDLETSVVRAEASFPVHSEVTEGARVGCCYVEPC